MADSPLPRVILLSGGLVCASLLAIYIGVGASLAHPESSALDGLPEPTRKQAAELYSSVRRQPWNSSEYLRLGMFFVANNRPAPAIEWLHRATVWTSAGYQPWYYLGLIYHASRRYPEARAAFERTLQINPDYIAARRQLADLLLDQNRFAEAADAYSELQGKPGADSARLAFGLGSAFLHTGNYNGAAGNFSTAIFRFSAYGDAHAGLSQTLKAQGDESRAAREARLATIWRNAVPIHADDPLAEQMEHEFPTGLSLFQSAVRMRDFRAGAEVLREALALDPSMTFAWEYLIGLEAEARRPKEAAAAWDRLRRIDPRNIRGRYELAVGLSQSDRAGARKLLTEALAIDPHYAEATRMLGVVAGLDGNRDEAVRQFRAALEIDPSLAEAHVDLGLLMLKDGRTRDAQAELLRALVPPCEAPERTLTRELAALRDNPFEEPFEQAVRAQATQMEQMSLITLLNKRNRQTQAARPIGIDGVIPGSSR